MLMKHQVVVVSKDVYRASCNLKHVGYGETKKPSSHADHLVCSTNHEERRQKVSS